MNFKEFLTMYDNWNGIVKVNDNNLKTIIKGKGFEIYDCNAKFHNKATIKDYDQLFERKVIAFGFYDNELCVRVK